MNNYFNADYVISIVKLLKLKRLLEVKNYETERQNQNL